MIFKEWIKRSLESHHLILTKEHEASSQLHLMEMIGRLESGDVSSCGYGLQGVARLLIVELTSLHRTDLQRGNKRSNNIKNWDVVP